MPFAGLGTTTQIIDRQRAELKKFLRASGRGSRYSTDPRNRNEMIALIASWLHLDQETAEHSYNVFFKAASKDGTLSRRGMEALVNERKRQAKFTGDLPLDRVISLSWRKLTASWENSFEIALDSLARARANVKCKDLTPGPPVNLQRNP